MSCAAHEDDLALLVSDDLPDDRALTLHDHLAQCAGCRAQLDEFRADAAWLRRQRHTPPAALVGEELRARIAGQIASRQPASWTVAWLRRLLESVTRRGAQPLLVGLAATLLVVGAVGALVRPLGRNRRDVDLLTAWQSGESARPARRHVDKEIDELTFDSPGFDSDDDEASGEEAVASSEVAESRSETAGALGTSDEATDLAAPSPKAMRIEMKTSDPDVRIIWFAEADGNESTRPRRP